MKNDKNDIAPKVVLILTIIFIICFWIYQLFIWPQIAPAHW